MLQVLTIPSCTNRSTSYEFVIIDMQKHKRIALLQYPELDDSNLLNSLDCQI